MDREGYKNKICSEKSTCHGCNILYSPTYKTGYIVQFYYLQKIIKKEIKMDFFKNPVAAHKWLSYHQAFKAISLTFFLGSKTPY